MKFTEQIKSIQQDLPITVRHDRWLLDNPNPVYSERAIRFAIRQLSEPQRDRARGFSGSATNSCERKQIFAWLGLPEVGWKDSKTPNILHNGNFVHLRWQMAGLTAGWLERAEVAVKVPRFNFRGTMDGVLYNGYGFEFKTINGYGFKNVMDYGAKPEHISQVQSYMMGTGIDHFSIVYESKDTNEWKEVVVPRDEQMINQIRESLEALNTYPEIKVLPEILSECKNEEGPKFRACRFRHICPLMKEWPDDPVQVQATA